MRAVTGTGPKPLLVVVSGKPGAGKSTLAQRLADRDALWLPLVSRDAIRTGLIETINATGSTDGRGPAITLASLEIYLSTIEHLLRAGFSVIAEQSFRRGLDERWIETLRLLARVVNVHCQVATEDAHRRFVEREARLRHDLHSRRSSQGHVDRMERGEFEWHVFEPLEVDVPRLIVDTTNGYNPDLDVIMAFCRAAYRSPDESTSFAPP